MRLQLKLGRNATKSKDGTHLLGVDVCQAATSSRAQARFTIGGDKPAFVGHAGALPRGGRVGHLSNPCWCPLTREEAGRDRAKDGCRRDVELSEVGVPQPARGEGPALLESRATTAAGPVCRTPSHKPPTLLLGAACQPTSEVKIDTAK